MTEFEFDFSGGSLCLDFANTVSDREAASPREHLADYADLLAWGRQAGILTAAQADALDRGARARPGEAAAVYRRAIVIREAIYRGFSAIAADGAPDAGDVGLLNDALAGAMAHARLVATAEGFAWGWDEEPALDRVLWPVARSAADLLAAGRLDTVRECAADDCNWLFLDLTKNHSRRWCDMKSCGNRAKAHRFYLRKKANA